MKEKERIRIDWKEHERQQFETYLREEYNHKEPTTAIVDRAMARMPENRRRFASSKLLKEAGEFMRSGTPLPRPRNETPTNGGAGAAVTLKPTPKEEIVRVGEEGRQPSTPVITKMGAFPKPATAPATSTAAPAPVATVADVLTTAVTEFLDVAEDKAVDFLVNVADRVLRHPAVVGALHGLVRSAFEKDVQTAVDKTTATWTDRGPTARLPRVLVAGITPKDTIFRDNMVEQYKESLSLRFWDEQSQSKGHLKQLIHGSSDVIILTSRVSHSAFQMIKGRVRKPPIFVDGGNEAAMQALEQLAKQSVIQQALNTSPTP